MRRTIGKSITTPDIITVTKQQYPFLIHFSSSFSTSASGGGRGRGGGGFAIGSLFTETPGKPDSVDSRPESTESPPTGLGHGRGRPIASDPIPPSFSSVVPPIKNSQPGTGRGRVFTDSSPSQPPQTGIGRGQGTTDDPVSAAPTPKTPIFAELEELKNAESNVPSSFLSAIGGSGCEKPAKKVASPEDAGPAKPKLSREEAMSRAMKILSRGQGDRGGGEVGKYKGTGGRGPPRWIINDDRRRRPPKYSEEGHGDGLYLGDDADGEKLAKRLGAQNMNRLVEGFDDISENVLPLPIEDAYTDAFHTNCLIEFEPEYMMENCDRNPDIDEKPPIPLRDALEKVKPFFMAYEGIQSQEEWEGAINQLMERLPLLKEIVDHYSGPDRVTAKKQEEELERVAKQIPESAPDSMKQFTNRAVLSLKSNPGWRFDKKCQFMDKLVREVSQQYK